MAAASLYRIDHPRLFSSSHWPSSLERRVANDPWIGPRRRRAPVVLRTLSLDEARLGNQACDALVGRMVALAGGAVAITGAWLRPELPAYVDEGAYLAARLRLDAVDTPVLLPFELLDTVDLSGDATPYGLFTLPLELQGAVLAAGLGPMLCELEDALGIDVSGIEPTPGEGLSGPCIELDLSWSARLGARFRAVLGIDPFYARQLRGRPSAPSANVNPVVRDLAVAARIQLAATWLADEDLRGLEPGDVIVLDEVCDTGGLWMTLDGGVCLDVDMQSTTVLTVRGVTVTEELPSNQNNGLRGDDVLVRLTVEVGRTEIKVRQLNALAPGYVLQLPENWATSRVYLTVGGQRFGEGELVNVGEGLGVQVAEIYRGRLD